MSTVTHTHTQPHVCALKSSSNKEPGSDERQLQVTLHLKKGWKSPDESTCNPPVHHHHRRVFLVVFVRLKENMLKHTNQKAVLIISFC